VLAESIGWPAFFIVSTLMALPALVMLWWMRATVRALEYDPARPWPTTELRRSRMIHRTP